MEAKGLRVNNNETKFFISGSNLNTQTQVSSSAVVVEGVVGSTFVFFISCSQWIHKKCNQLIGKFEANLGYQCGRCVGIACLLNIRQCTEWFLDNQLDLNQFTLFNTSSIINVANILVMPALFKVDSTKNGFLITN